MRTVKKEGQYYDNNTNNNNYFYIIQLIIKIEIYYKYNYVI